MNDVIKSASELALSPQYDEMLSKIREMDPEVRELTSHHGKSHTQFQYVMLDNAGPIAGPTKLRNLRQVLAVIERTRNAIESALFRTKKARLQAAKFRKKAEKAKDDADYNLFLLKAEEKEIQAVNVENSMQGAVRKLATYVSQVETLTAAIRQELGKAPDEPITEADYEEDEERFHIMKAFEQALIAARSNNGRIDHGNLIYFRDIGISGLAAQAAINQFFKRENDFLQRNPGCTHELHDLETAWLEGMYRKFKGCAMNYAKQKGMLTIAPIALLGAAEFIQDAATE